VAISPLQAFGWGCVGSFAVKVVLFCQAVRHSRNSRVPSLYRTTAFIVGRVLGVGAASAEAGVRRKQQRF
jgi:hypothetical protein